MLQRTTNSRDRPSHQGSRIGSNRRLVWLPPHRVAATTRLLRFGRATIPGNQIEKEPLGSSDSDAIIPGEDAFSCSLEGVNWENAVAKSLRSYPLDWRAST
jgi:hypothetical protein